MWLRSTLRELGKVLYVYVGLFTDPFSFPDQTQNMKYGKCGIQAFLARSFLVSSSATKTQKSVFYYYYLT